MVLFRRSVVVVFRMLLGACLGACLLDRVVAHPEVPYNIPELFSQRQQQWGMFLFSLFLIWMILAPKLIDRALREHQRSWLKQLAYTFCLLLSAAVIGWFLLRYSVSTESLWDLFGTPILRGVHLFGIDDWEIFFRALPVLLLPLWGMVFVHGIFVRREVVIRGLLGAILLSLAKWAVFDLAATDNVRELFRPTPYAFPLSVLSFLLIVFGIRLVAAVRTIPLLFIALGTLPLLLWGAYSSFEQAFSPEMFQLLFGKDRELLLLPFEMEERFLAVAVVATFLAGGLLRTIPLSQGIRSSVASRGVSRETPFHTHLV